MDLTGFRVSVDGLDRVGGVTDSWQRRAYKRSKCQPRPQRRGLEIGKKAKAERSKRFLQIMGTETVDQGDLGKTYWASALALVPAVGYLR